MAGFVKEFMVTLENKSYCDCVPPGGSCMVELAAQTCVERGPAEFSCPVDNIIDDTKLVLKTVRGLIICRGLLHIPIHYSGACGGGCGADSAKAKSQSQCQSQSQSRVKDNSVHGS